MEQEWTETKVSLKTNIIVVGFVKNQKRTLKIQNVPVVLLNLMMNYMNQILFESAEFETNSNSTIAILLAQNKKSVIFRPLALEPRIEHPWIHCNSSWMPSTNEILRFKFKIQTNPDEVVTQIIDFKYSLSLKLNVKSDENQKQEELMVTDVSDISKFRNYKEYFILQIDVSLSENQQELKMMMRMEDKDQDESFDKIHSMREWEKKRFVKNKEIQLSMKWKNRGWRDFQITLQHVALYKKSIKKKALNNSS